MKLRLQGAGIVPSMAHKRRPSLLSMWWLHLVLCNQLPNEKRCQFGPDKFSHCMLPSYGENGQCTQKKYISLSPLLAQCRSEMLFFFFLPYTPSLRVCMERRRKKHSHSCTGPGVGRGKCIFSGRIVRFLHMGVFY